MTELVADDLDKKILTSIQKGIPLVSRPWAELGAALGVGEAEVLERLRKLKADRVVRQISAIFDTRRLGYKSTLVAMRFPPERLDAAAAVVSSHPGVSHNYARSHAFNLWFTLALPPAIDLAQGVAFLGRKAGCEECLILPTLRMYKIGVKLDVGGEEGEYDPAAAAAAGVASPAAGPRLLDEGDIAVVREAQEDLPIEPTPWSGVAARAGLREEELFTRLRRFQEEGIVRRIAGVLHHRAAGFGSNAMAVWIAPEERLDELGAAMAGFRAVSHCYRRPTYSNWPYNLFTMLHAKSPEECEATIRSIAEKTGLTRYDRLYSTREYKKVRLKYFTRELDAWTIAD